MKTIAFLAVAMLLGAGQVIACDKHTSKDAQTAKSDKSKTKNRVVTGQQGTLTGSYIKREVRRNGYMTDGPNLVVIYDAETIRRSGAADVRQFLVRGGRL